MEEQLSDNSILLALGRELLKQGVSIKAIRSATLTPRIMQETADRFAQEYARAGRVGKVHYMPLLEDLRLPARARRGLQEAGFTQTQELCLCTAKGLGELRNIGVDAISAVSESLAQFGLRMRTSDDAYSDRIIMLYPDLAKAPITVLHLENPKALKATKDTHELAHIFVLGDLLRRTESELRQASTNTGFSRALIYGGYTINAIKKTLSTLGLTLKGE